MSFLLDTNVLSELRKRHTRVDPGVAAWIQAMPSDAAYVSVITVLELEVGVGRLARRDPAQGKKLRTWLDTVVLVEFEHRLLDVDLDVARSAGQLHAPSPRPERDAMIAATAIVHDLTVVTRNVADFGPLGVVVHNPWRN